MYAMKIAYRLNNCNNSIKFNSSLFSPCTYHCVAYITRQLPVTTNTSTYRVLSDDLHGCIFGPLSCHLQALKYIKLNLQLQLHFVAILILVLCTVIAGR